MSVLSYKGASKSYVSSHLGKVTEVPALHSLDLDIAAGEIVGLLGLNGAGKTTTLKLALGLLFPTKGEVTVCGHPASDPRALKRVGYLPELPYFYSHMTPREALSFYGRLSGVPERSLPKKIDATLERVGLGPKAAVKIAGFSKGMLQRVGLAQAILHEPDLLLLDEPVSGLDPLAMAEMRALFAELNKEGRTVVLSSHSISEVEKLCHRVAILKAGRLARVVDHKEWGGDKLEKIFVETVKG